MGVVCCCFSRYDVALRNETRIKGRDLDKLGLGTIGLLARSIVVCQHALADIL